MKQVTIAFVNNRAAMMQALIAKRFKKHAVTVTYRTGSPFVKHKYEIQIGRGTQYEVSGNTKRDLVDNSVSFMQGFWCGISADIRK